MVFLATEVLAYVGEEDETLRKTSTTLQDRGGLEKSRLGGKKSFPTLPMQLLFP